ncbi:EH signature domain-containing protein [Flavobacterium sp. j3]|uniref:EH signature domain-containing protein n=1 Tax=Flavobacterium aureirubrum TaxID=3133147 RepID=A0ABU9N5Z9_9FLAO
MNKINDILNFYFSPSDFHNRSKSVIPVTLKNQLDLRIGELQKIKDEIGEMSFQFDNEKLIPGVFRKFKKFLNSNSVILDRRELSTLTYSLTYSERNLQTVFSNENELIIALEAMDNNWRDSFLSGLIDCFLSNWETKHQKSLEKLGQFIAKKLENYTGKRSSINSFKNNNRFFNIKNGSEILGYELALKNINISFLPMYLGVPEKWISYDYFSKSIVAYYQKNEPKIIEIFDDLINVLKSHQSGNQTGSDDIKKTAKRLISKIIIKANQPQFAILQDKLKEIAFTQIGDPSNISNWTAFENATDAEKNELVEARNILDEWIAKQFIDIFFRVCINDVRRKKFWLKIASKNKVTFKVYGSAQVKQQLGLNKNIAEYLDSRFEIVESNKNVSAFILYTADYMLIEFSNAGYAFYAYKIDGLRRPKLINKLKSIDMLRNSNVNMLVYRSGYSITSTNIEGRLGHNDGDLSWEQVFEYWFKNIAGINV